MTLEALREQIDAIDAQFLELLQRRLSVSEQIGDYKKEHGLPILDEARQTEKINKLCQLADTEDEAAVRALFAELMRLSRARQEGLL